MVFENGKLTDTKDQDPNSSYFKFASKLTELYDDCCKYYPQFQRLKQLCLAIYLSTWLYQRNYKLQTKQASKFTNYQNCVPSLFHGNELFFVFGGVNLSLSASEHENKNNLYKDSSKVNYLSSIDWMGFNYFKRLNFDFTSSEFANSFNMDKSTLKTYTEEKDLSKSKINNLKNGI